MTYLELILLSWFMVSAESHITKLFTAVLLQPIHCSLWFTLVFTFYIAHSRNYQGKCVIQLQSQPWCTNIGIILCNWTSVNGTTQFLYHCENKIWLWILWGNCILTSPQSVWTVYLPALGSTVFNLFFLLLRSERKILVESRDFSISQHLGYPQNRWQDFSCKINIWMRLVLKKIKWCLLI